MRASVFIATSLDGYIARENGAIDWLPSGAELDGEDYGYKKFFAGVDFLVMGRKSYETVLAFPAWPYERKPIVVLSSRKLDIPARVAGTVEAMNGTPEEVVKALAKRGAKHLYVDGGATIQGFLKAGLIQTLIITRVPVILGSGIPLFGRLERDLKLRHRETRSYPSGFVQSEYEVGGA